MKYREIAFACFGAFVFATAVSYLAYRITRAETENYFLRHGLCFTTVAKTQDQILPAPIQPKGEKK